MPLADVAQLLRRHLVTATPCEWLNVISVFDDEHYDNFDYDGIDPGARRRIAIALRTAGFTQKSGRVFISPETRFEFPRPTRTLSSDPAAELERTLATGVAAFATPTQVVLTTWRREGPTLAEERLAQLERLVHDQPANLDKVRDWLRRSDSEVGFRRQRSRLDNAQEEGYEKRRQRRGG